MPNESMNFRARASAVAAAIAMVVFGVAVGLAYAGWRSWGNGDLLVGIIGGVLLLIVTLPVIGMLYVVTQDNA